MTNHYIDIRNADRILIIGSNAAENHPISFKWVTEAISRGAKLINVDPRFTRTSSKAHIYAPIRSGTDIAFMGGMMKWIIEDMDQNPGNYNMDYVKQYTNAALIVNSNARFPGDTGQDGLWSGFNPVTNAYDKATWQYGDTTNPQTDTTLQDPNCVFQLLKKHYSRYTLEAVSDITGCPVDKLEEVYSAYAESGAAGKAGTIMYAMGTTQHTYGVQNIRTYAMVQLLLANMGVTGGGVNALRGTSNVQGSTDMCLLSHILPGYLAVPADSDTSLEAYLNRATPATVTPVGLAGDKSANWWSNYKKYMVSLLAAWYGSEVQTNPDACFHRLPKVKSGKNYTHIAMFEAMGKGEIEGLWCWGQNPAVGGPDSNAERTALGKLKWLVVTDIWKTETAEFWRRPGVNPADIDTEVIVLPAACSYEKQGSISNSGRWAQWRWQAMEPVGEAKPDLAITSMVILKLKELYEADPTAPNREAITKLIWDYDEHPDPDDVAKEINGYNLTTGELVVSFGALKDDGTTTSGNWLYCNQYTEADGNKLKSRDTVDYSLNQVGLYSKWSWCWPLNRRIIYNRASVDLDGNPWDAEHPVIAWNSVTGKWEGDVPDGGWAPIALADEGAKYLPFIMKPDGVGHIWGGFSLKDGPFPEVYEPWESPIDNIMSPQQINPVAFIGDFMNPHGAADEFPYVGTTYRCTEHWQTGIMTRNLPWLVELMPQMYVELGEDLAAQKGINKGDKVKVSSARGHIEAVAVVTERFHGMIVGGKNVHHIGVPWCFGYAGMATGDSGNILTPHVGDANTTIPEYKTFLCNIEKV